MEKIRWGLIGCGDISRQRVAPALRDLENVEFVSVSRKQSEKAAEFAGEFGAKKWYSDWREQLQDDGIDAVYIATPVNLHAEQTIYAAQYGKHVLCEKPMAINVADCEDMLQAARTNGIKLGVAYYRHFYPVILRIKELVRGGAIGKLVLIQSNSVNQYNPGPDEPRYWLMVENESGGGPMMDFGCHRIQVFQNIAGPIKRTCSLTGNILYDRQVEDTATALFQFESGVQGVLSVSHAAKEPQDTLKIFGTEGSLHVENLNRGDLRLVSGGEETIEHHPPHPNLHHPLINDFTETLLEGRDKPGVTGEMGRDVNAVLDEIYGRNR